MDYIQLRIAEELDAFDELSEIVETFINGRNLRDIVREIEQPFAARDGQPDLAGSYVGLPPEDVFLPSRRFLGERERDYDDEHGRCQIAVLGCGCGVVGCWPLLVEIVEAEDRVTWRNFRQPFRSGWSFDLLEPFVFDRPQYLAQLGRTGDEAVQYG